MRSPIGKKATIGVGLLGTITAAMIWTGLLLGPAAGQKTTDEAEPAAETTQTRLTEQIERGDLTETKDETGSVSYGQSWSAPIETQGIVTRRHDKGTVIGPGEPLVWIGNKPVTLAAGDTPLYRVLQLQGATESKHMTGDDVRQLQEFLLSQGADDKERLEADGIFGISTKRAVREWQKARGLEETGTIDRTLLVFHPDSVRIDSEPQIGANFGDLQLTEKAQEVKARFDSKSRAFLQVGGTVSIEAGDSPIDGTITGVESVVGDDGSQQLEATVEATTPLPEGTERVKVVATRTVAADVLHVPVRAILALAGGGYGLEVETASGVELRAVELGSVVDDSVEISGDYVAGDRVIVPNDRFGDQ